VSVSVSVRLGVGGDACDGASIRTLAGCLD
jgi:hypothetical protein